MKTITSTIVRTEGTSTIFKTLPAVGILSLIGFTDDASGTGEFIKTFRFSLNGIDYSNWVELTLDNIRSIQPKSRDVFICEIKYSKENYQDDSIVSSVQIDYDEQETSNATDIFDKTIFKKYFNIDDAELLNWYINVLEKIYLAGAVPNFIDRKDVTGSNEDYLKFWSAVIKFTALYVKFARVIVKFYGNETLAIEFLEQSGVFLSPENSLEKLKSLIFAYYREMSKRGTTIVMDDELLRLIHHKEAEDEYMWLLFKKERFGWNLGNSSPLFRGLRNQDNLNKIPWSPRYVSVDNAQLYTDGEIIEDNQKNVIQLSGSKSVSFLSYANSVLIDSRLDYQFSLRLKLIDGTFSIKAKGYDIEGNEIPLLSKIEDEDQEVIVSEGVLSRSDRYLTVRFFIYNDQSGLSVNNVTSIKQGNNLRLKSNIHRLGLSLEVIGNALAYDFKLIPLITPYSRGILQSNNWISLWIINRNKKYNQQELKDEIAKNLIPYNCQVKLTDIETYKLSVVDSAEEQFVWVGEGEYCRRVDWIGINESCELQKFEWVPDEDTAYCE